MCRMPEFAPLAPSARSGSASSSSALHAAARERVRHGAADDAAPDDGDLGLVADQGTQVKRLTNSSAVSATSRQPLSIVSACPRLGISVISVTPVLRAWCL